MDSTVHFNRRRVFRLRLPEGSLLTAKIGGTIYNVMEVAEYSLWLTVPEVANINGVCAGKLRWSDGSQTDFSGELGRINAGGRVILNVEGISMRDVVGEQRRLIQRYAVTSGLKKTS